MRRLAIGKDVRRRVRQRLKQFRVMNGVDYFAIVNLSWRPRWQKQNRHVQTRPFLSWRIWGRHMTTERIE